MRLRLSGLSYNVKAKSNEPNELSINCRFFDGATGKSLGTTIGLGLGCTEATEIGYHHYEVNQTLVDCEEVIILFFFSDANLANNEEEFWVEELNIYGSEEGETYLPDIVDPIIYSSEDLTYTEGTLGNTINWTIVDESNGTFALYMNWSYISGGTWVNGDIISKDVNFLEEGIYYYTLVAIDTFDNYAESTIIVTVTSSEVIDTENPVIMSTGDVAYIEGHQGKYINWTIVDESTGIYVLLRDGLLLEVDSWISGEIISINVDNLAEGVYNYTLIAIDASGNQAIRSVFVVVAKPERTAFPSMYVLLISFCLMLPIIYRRKKKN